MITYNIVVRIANDKDFLSPIFASFGRIKKEGVAFKFNVIGKIYSHPVYDRLTTLAAALDITGNIHFTKTSIRYIDLDEEIKKGFFINYSLDDVVGYATMEAMNLGFKTILFNCDPAITKKSGRLSFCNTANDLFDITMLLAQNEEATTTKIVEENMAFRNNFFLNKVEETLLLSLL